MAGARSLIAAFYELNRSTDRTVAHFTPSLVGLFGSITIFDSFLQEIDNAISCGKISASVKKRAANLIDTFIPQVAEYNSVSNLSAITATAGELKKVTAASLENRRQGIELILSALIQILQETGDLTEQQGV